MNAHKTIGILAGMGPRSTAPFLSMVLDECQKQYGAKNDEDFPHVITYSLPTPYFVDRPVDEEKLKQVILSGAKRLAGMGVDCIAMPCNVAHLFFDEIQTAITIPLLNMVEETAKRLPPEKKSIGLIATETTVRSGIYQKYVARHDRNMLEAGEETQKNINRLIQKMKQAVPLALLLPEWQAIVTSFQKNGANGLIIGCTDLSVFAKETHALLVVDSGTSLAAATIKWYCGAVSQ